MAGHDETFARWQNDPEAFWAELAGLIDWEHPPRQIMG